MSGRAADLRGLGAAPRTRPPPSRIFNPTCTVAVVSTTAGVRAFELMDSLPAVNHHGPIAQSLLPSFFSKEEKLRSFAAHEASPQMAERYPKSPPSLCTLWETPVYVATVAGESAVIAVVFRARPAVFTPSVHTMRATERASQARKENTQTSSAYTASSDGRIEVVLTDEEDGSEVDIGLIEREARFSSLSSFTTAELFASEAEYRRYIYLFDATTGLCLAALHFCGSPVLTLRANAAVLLVVAADLFHVVELDALRYVRQQSMYRPANPRAILDLSSAVPIRVKKPLTQSTKTESSTGPSAALEACPQYSYVIAFPQSARGYRGDVTVLTLRTAPRPSSFPSREPPHHTLQVESSEQPSPQPSMQQQTIAAHHHAIAHLRLRRDGRLLVTASELGTTLKVFDCTTGSLLVELQRGHRPASVLSLGLQYDAYRVAALSTNGTLHVFNCAAVVQSWEAGKRRLTAASPTTSTVAASSSAPSALPINKTRADYKLRVPLLYERESRHLVGRARDTIGINASSTLAEPNVTVPVNLPNDGSIHHDVGFAADGRTVWVAQVESTETQLEFERLHGVTAGANRIDDLSSVHQTLPLSAGHKKRCVGKLTRFPMPLPGCTFAANVEVEGVSFSIEV